MKFSGLFSLAVIAIGSISAAAVDPNLANPPQTPSNSTDPNAQAPNTNTAIPVNPATNTTTPVNPTGAATNSTSPADTLKTCGRNHKFTRREKKEMNDVLAVLTLLLQFQLFVNPDRSKDNVMYGQLLPIYREAKNLHKNMNMK